MTAHELRQLFLNHFEKQDHAVVSSSDLLDREDPSVLLTTAGMQQFKPYYSGKKNAQKDFGSVNTTSVQKCFRTTDIDEVGDTTHQTFIEMMGNFSFGGYYKEEAIAMADEFLRNVLFVDKKRIHVTIFEGDDKTPADEESVRIWKHRGYKDVDIKREGREDNFWGPTGDEGPCGPTTEIYIDGVEVWNLVFNEYYCDKDGNFTPLETKGIDTGMGLERLAAAIQGAENNFRTDLFAPLVEYVTGNAKQCNERSVRIIADHMRGAAFLLSEKLAPSNSKEGYVLRRILRRAIRHVQITGLSESWFKDMLDTIIKIYDVQYPEIKKNKDYILGAIETEQEAFLATLERGTKEFLKIADSIGDSKEFPADKAFYLYESFGFPLEVTQDLANERKMKVSEEEFQRAFESHQDKSRQQKTVKIGGIREGASDQEIKHHTATHLLHAALRGILGDSVKQMGSDIEPESFRFDFSFDRALTDEEKSQITHQVNDQIKSDLKVTKEEMKFTDAIDAGAIAFFKGKYPDTVKVYSIGDVSKEVCNGPHVESTKGMGTFEIMKEKSSSRGVRRIKARIT